MRHRWIYVALSTLFSLGVTNCGLDHSGVRVLGTAEWTAPRLLYVLPELECASCIERLKPFVELMAGEPDYPDQMVLILSADLTDRQGFANYLGLEAIHAHRADFFNRDVSADTSPAMMILFSKNKEVIFARPVTFTGHDMTFLKEEIMQLSYEFGGH